MQTFSLEFRNPHLERKYTEFKWKFNKKPGAYLLAFNLYFAVGVSIYAVVQSMHQVVFYNIALFGCLATLFYLSNKASPHKSIQTLYIIAATVVPYQVEVYFMVTEMRARNAGPAEWLLTGALSQIFIGFMAKFRVPWFFVISSKWVACFYNVYLNLNEKSEFNESLVMTLIIMLVGILGDYNQDKNDRDSFLNSMNAAKKNELYRNLIELIPDQVLIWKEDQFIYANRSAFMLFNQSDLKNLQETLFENIEILEFNGLIDLSKDKKSLFSLKLIETLKADSEMDAAFNNLPLLTAYVKSQNERGPFICEYDLKLKKIFWENDDAVLVLMSKVDEKNVNARLEYVNSFLNYVLGNVSHEIATPFNILLGFLDSAIPQVKDKEVVKDLKIARNMGEILINMVHTMIDLFNIRKGSLIFNLEILNLQQEFKDCLNLFSEILSIRNVVVSFTGSFPSISTDRRRVRQLIIGILNFSLKHIENAEIHIIFSKKDDLLDITFESHFSKQTLINGENYIPSSLKDVMLKTTNNNILKRGQTNSALSESEGVIIDSGMNISMLDYLILCLSAGDMEHLKIDHKQFSHYICNFKLKDIRNSASIRFKDLILDQKSFNVHYFKGGDSEDDSIDSTPIHDDTILAFSMDNTRTHEIKSYTQVFKMMPSNSDLELKITKKCGGLGNLMSPFIKRSQQFHSGFSSSSRESIKDSLVSGYSRKKHFILNVDDNDLNRMVISKYCQDFTFEVIEAKNGLEAINEVERLLKREKVAFDLIFMDCDMPILDGFEASRKINEIYSEKQTFQPGIVAITANMVNEEIRMKIKKNGMRELVLKPLSSEKFREILYKYLNICA